MMDITIAGTGLDGKPLPPLDDLNRGLFEIQRPSAQRAMNIQFALSDGESVRSITLGGLSGTDPIILDLGETKLRLQPGEVVMVWPLHKVKMTLISYLCYKTNLPKLNVLFFL